MEQRFHTIKTEWCFPNCISHETFREPSKGYLVNGKCVFGVDVYVIKNHGVGKCVSLLDQSKSRKHKWKISEFTKVTNTVRSEEQLGVTNGILFMLFLSVIYIYIRRT